MADPNRLREYNQAWDDGRTRASYEGWLEHENERLLHGICDALKTPGAREPILRALLRGTKHEHEPAFDEEQR